MQLIGDTPLVVELNDAMATSWPEGENPPQTGLVESGETGFALGERILAGPVFAVLPATGADENVSSPAAWRSARRPAWPPVAGAIGPVATPKLGVVPALRGIPPAVGAALPPRPRIRRSIIAIPTTRPINRPIQD